MGPINRFPPKQNFEVACNSMLITVKKISTFSHFQNPSFVLKFNATVTYEIDNEHYLTKFFLVKLYASRKKVIKCRKRNSKILSENEEIIKALT